MINFYNQEIPKQTKSRFRNIALYKNCKYEGQREQRIKIEKLLKEIQTSKTRDKWISDAFNILQETYTMIENNFSSIEIVAANKKHLEKMIERNEREIEK
jgi:hypothetical protein